MFLECCKRFIISESAYMSFFNSCSESNAPPSFNYFEYQAIQCNEALSCFCIIIFQGIYISRRNRPYGRKCFGNCTRFRSPFHRIIVPPHNKVIITTVFLSPTPPPHRNIHRDKSSVITCSVYSCMNMLMIWSTFSFVGIAITFHQTFQR